MVHITAVEKADQLERDFGIPHPRRSAFARLRRPNGAEVTAFQAFSARERINELVGKGYSRPEAAVILLMRGGRREAIAEGCGYHLRGTRGTAKANLAAFLGEMRATLGDRHLRVEALVAESQKTYNLMRRA